jgi:hypothetical protein
VGETSAVRSRVGGRTRSLCALVAIVAFALLAPAGAGAAASHHFSRAINTGLNPLHPAEPCTVHDLDLDAEEDIYAICGGEQSFSAEDGTVLKKFDKNGNPIPFTAEEPYLQGNAIVENPDPTGGFGETDVPGLTFQRGDKVAVDTSSGPAAGRIYIASSGSQVEVFAPSGEYLGKLRASGNFGLQSVATDGKGNVYDSNGYKIDKREASLSLTGQLYDIKNVHDDFSVLPAGNDLAFDSEGNVWGSGSIQGGLKGVFRWEANQFGPVELESTFSFGSHTRARLSPAADSPLLAFGQEGPVQASSLAVDRADNSLYLEDNEKQQILQFSDGTVADPSHQVEAPIGDASNVGAPENFANGPTQGIAVSAGGTLYAAAGTNSISVFAAGEPLPVVNDRPIAVADVDHTEVTVRADIERAGGGPITGCEVEYGTTRAYGQTAPCTPDPSGANFTAGTTAVSAHLTGLTTGQNYHFAFVASNAEGTGVGADQTFSPAAVLGVETRPATEISDHSAKFNGALKPNGESTTYHFEYGLEGELTASTPASAPISDGGEVAVSFAAPSLATGKEYEYRLVATNALGTTDGPLQRFDVAGPPRISGVHAAHVRSTEVDLEGRVDPGGYATTYEFEYGLTTNYGSVAPAAPGEAGAGDEAVSILTHLSGLEPGRTYHFRLVATNAWGTTTGDDTSFNFVPQECPNEAVRQQTKSSFLPDCRAYELVSPENAGGAQIYPGDEAYVAGREGFPAFQGIGSIRSKQNTGLANSPPRFSFYVGLGALPGLEPPSASLDQYTSTRTNEGWVTTFSGLKGNEAGLTGNKVCSSDLGECLDHTVENPFREPSEDPRNYGYLFNVAGEKLGTVPTNVESIPGGLKYEGDWKASPDFSHFAFSSRNVVFAAGGTTAAPGSAYDNNLQTGAVQVISKLPSGAPIPSGGERGNQFITFPPNSVSTDGSHILMQTRAPNGGHRLYMRVNDSTTYEIGAGPTEGEPAEVTYIDMSSDGSKVLFATEAKLVPEDTDTSNDIYMWQENGGHPTLTLLSQGSGPSAVDKCNATWTERCSVALVETEDEGITGLSEPSPTGLEYGEVIIPGTDSKASTSSGGVFFFSPETLAGPAPQNGKNLYLANDGEIQYVATLGAKQAIDRIQISPDGKHAGFLTRAKLTNYENEEYEEMYSYDAVNQRLFCVSCIPDGAPPTADVEASQNGPFMSDHGRLFFSTADPLVPADADPFRIPDVYEYSEGRAQLISSGTSSNGKAPGGAGAFSSEPLGLESVSASGQDVFFSTTDTLVPQDANGHFVKIYDARTNGGFAVAPQPAPCVAADECHGVGATTPPSLAVGTGSNARGGNAKATKAKCPKGKVKATVKRKGKKVQVCKAKPKKAQGKKSAKHKAKKGAQQSTKSGDKQQGGGR